MWREGDTLGLLNIRCNQVQEMCQNIRIEQAELELMMMVMTTTTQCDSFLI